MSSSLPLPWPWLPQPSHPFSRLPPHEPGAPVVGLRDRKKALTRQYISDVGTQLFLERGFEAVTVAEIAAAADVSVKTVFNYFRSKEDLLLDREEEIVGSLDALAATRAGSVGLVPMLIADVAVRYPATDDFRWSQMSAASMPARRRFAELVADTPALQGRWLTIAERLRIRVLALAAADLGVPPSSPEAVAAGTLLHAAYSSAGPAGTQALMAGGSVTDVVAAAVGTAMEALARVEAAYEGTALVDGPAPATAR